MFTFISILSDQQSWNEIQAFSLENLDWFAQYINASSGIPSHDRFRRVFSLLDPGQLEEVIVAWAEKTRAQKGSNQRRIVVLNGKALRGVACKVEPNTALYLKRLGYDDKPFLGKMTIDSKTNEITVASKLLRKLNLKSPIVSIDGLMTQKDVAETLLQRAGE